MKIPVANLARTETWIKYTSRLCDSCNASCCKLAVEVRLPDLVRMGLVDYFEAEEPVRNIAKRLKKEGLIQHFSGKHNIFTLSQMSNGDCYFLDGKTRRCSIYENRPTTCRKHPQVGPRPNYCAYIPKK